MVFNPAIQRPPFFPGLNKEMFSKLRHRNLSVFFILKHRLEGKRDLISPLRNNPFHGDKVKASYKDGALTIVLPKSAHAKEKEI